MFKKNELKPEFRGIGQYGYPAWCLKTIRYAFSHRFSEKVVEQIFTWILSEVEAAGYL